MNKTIIMVLALLASAWPALAGDTQRTFTVRVEPQDAVIKVSPVNGSREQLYSSPASITATVPEDKMLSRKAVIEISRNGYKPVIIPIGGIRDGEVLKVELVKDIHKHIVFRMADTPQSDDIAVRDDRMTIALTVDPQHLEMSLTNHTSRPVKVIWQRAVYTDVNRQQHRVMHSGIRYQDRNSALPYQTIMPYVTIHQTLLPVDLVYLNAQKKIENRPLFAIRPGDLARIGEFELVIPVEIEYVVVPYKIRVRMQTFAE